MGTWENNQNALREYANTLRGGIPSNYKNISNVALGSMINAAWAKQAQEEAERKRLLEVQKQKDLDAAEERKLKLKKMQYELDDIENARNDKNLLNTLAPYKPSFGFDSDTGENITSGSIPFDPIFKATINAAGFNLANTDLTDPKSDMMKKALDSSLKAMSAESSNPEQYAKMTESERQKAIDDILAPYEITYESRWMTPDIYKANKIYDRNIYNTDAKLVMNQNTNETKENVAGINAKGKTDEAKIKANGGIQKEVIKGVNNSKIKDKDIAAKMAANMNKLYLGLRSQISLEMSGASPEAIDKKARELLKEKFSKELSRNDFEKVMKIFDRAVTEPRNKAMPKKQILDKEISYANK